MELFQDFTKYVLNLAKTEELNSTLINTWQHLYDINVNELTKYNESKVKELNSNKKQDKLIVLTITTCKRYNLFVKTVNSILNTWSDLELIDEWVVVDDNSSKEDRKLMVDKYPFINFYMKSYDERGHLQSMNIIYNYLQVNKPKYWIHIEDDMLFFLKHDYISAAMQAISELNSFNVKQIIFNRNYAETFDHINLKGHINYENIDLALHNYKPKGQCCTYWPNFSFRPSLIDVESILSIGSFTSTNTFFEFDYALKYTEKDYRSAFFNMITHLHIGRLCNTKGQNAYLLNNTPQFNGELSKSFNIKVINLKRRTDRLKSITEKLQSESLPFDVFEAIDGTTLQLTEDIKRIFKDNDFNYRRGVIGCALSHIALWKELVKSECPYYLIIEDDASFCKNFKVKISELESVISQKDLLFFGYIMHTANKNDNKQYFVNSNTITINSIQKQLYVGGTHCYSITKKAANEMLNYIDTFGVKHGIDYLLVKVQKILNVYETLPFLSTVEWNETLSNIDTDIQNDNVSLLNNNIPIVDDKNDSILVIDNREDNINEYTIDDSLIVVNDTNGINNTIDFIFVKSMDQVGYDIHYVDTNNIKELKAVANKITTCVAFNTLGFFKSKVDDLNPSVYYSESDGIYIRSDYYYNVLKKKE